METDGLQNSISQLKLIFEKQIESAGDKAKDVSLM